MAEEPEKQEPDTDEKPKKAFDLSSLIRAITVDETPIGSVEIRGLSFGGLEKLEKADKEAPFTPESFLRELVRNMVRRPDSPKEELGSEEIEQLLGDRERIIPALIQASHFFDKPISHAVTAGGEGGEKNAGRQLVTERKEGEGDEEYLLRGYREYVARTMQTFRNMFSDVADRLKGFTPSLGKSLAAGLMDNMRASQRVADRLASMRSGQEELARRLAQSPTDAVSKHLRPDHAQRSVPLRLPELPPNPIFQTNKLLHELGEDIAEMRELAIETADMQQSLNDVASRLLTEFTVGAADSKAAADKTLKIARYGLAIAAVSAVFAAVAIFVTVWTSGPSDNELQLMREQREATQQELRLTREQVRATQQQIELLRENHAAVAQLTSRLTERAPSNRRGSNSAPSL
jgi:hypothetical protein